MKDIECCLVPSFVYTGNLYNMIRYNRQCYSPSSVAEFMCIVYAFVGLQNTRGYVLTIVRKTSTSMKQGGRVTSVRSIVKD